MRTFSSKIWALIFAFIVITIAFMYLLTDFLYEQLYVEDTESSMIEYGEKLATKYKGGPGERVTIANAPGINDLSAIFHQSFSTLSLLAYPIWTMFPALAKEQFEWARFYHGQPPQAMSRRAWARPSEEDSTSRDHCLPPPHECCPSRARCRLRLRPTTARAKITGMG